MNAKGSGSTALREAMMELDGINSRVAFLTSVGMEQEATGARIAWIRAAIRVALMPAATRAEVEFKAKMLAGNLHGWAFQVAEADGLVAGMALILGALHAEAHEWGADVPKDWDSCGIERQAEAYMVTFDPGTVAGYSKDAKRPTFRAAIRRYDILAEEVAKRIAKGEERPSLEGLLQRARDAFLDAMSVTARDVRQLERKQQAYMGLVMPRDFASWMLMSAVSVAFKTELRRLKLPAAEVKRFEGKFSSAWTSSEPPPEFEASASRTMH